MKIQKLTVAILILCAMLAAACGTNNASTSSNTTAAEPAAAATPTEAATQEAPAPADTPTTAAAESAPAESAPAGEAATYKVDLAASKVEWYGSKPIGKSESGTVNIKEGELTFNGEQLTGGTIVIDMDSIATTTQSGGMADQLLGHLKSDEFFGVATYPTAQLVLKSAEPTGTANQYKVKGDLTIKETTKEIEFVTDATAADGALNGTAKIVVNRADFDVRYGSAAFFSGLGDNLISDEMEMTVTVVAKKA